MREPRPHAPQLLKRANHQAGADEQDEGERHLHHDQRVARPVALPARAERSADTTQGGRDTGPCVFQDRYDTEQRAREQRHAEGEREHERIDADFAQPRQCVRAIRHQDPQRRVRQAETQRAAQHSQRQAFDEHFTGDSSPAGAERRPDRQFLLAGLGADEHQVGHVGAGDQKYQPQSPHHDPERRADVSDDFLLQWLKPGRRGVRCQRPCDPFPAEWATHSTRRPACEPHRRWLARS